MSAVKPELNLFDLGNAASAALSEALSRPFRFTYKTEVYELPNQKLWPLSAMASLSETGDIAAFLRETGAKEQVYTRLLEQGLVVGELEVLIEAASADAGIGGLPNSKPPARPGSTRT